MRFPAEPLQRLRPQQHLSVSSDSGESLEDTGRPSCLHHFSNRNKIFFLSVPPEESDAVCIFIWIMYLSVYRYIRFSPVKPVAKSGSGVISYSRFKNWFLDTETQGWVLQLLLHARQMWLVDFSSSNIITWNGNVSYPKLNTELSSNSLCRGGSDHTTAFTAIIFIKWANWWQWYGKK